VLGQVHVGSIGVPRKLIEQIVEEAGVRPSD
jgi:hypothetical protein